MIELALGLRGREISYNNMLLAKQLGCEKIVITPFQNSKELPKDSKFFSYINKPLAILPDEEAYSYERLREYVKTAEAAGLKIGAVENFSPLDVYDILLNGKEKNVQLEKVKRIISNVAKAGISIIGYNFNIAGVYGRKEVPGRGNATLLEFDEKESCGAIPLGMVWNRVYDFYPEDGFLGRVDREEVLRRYFEFLSEIITVAENEDVTLALHPNDPPTEYALNTGRLICRPDDFDKIYKKVPSEKSKLLFCVGTFAEMRDCDVYDFLKTQLSIKKVGYLHIRNVTGKLPKYTETFIDNGDVDVGRIIKILKESEYDGLIMPDHTPGISAKSIFETGMAYTLGYLKALLNNM